MKPFLFGILLLLTFSSCGGDDDNRSDCKFIGKWCQPSPFNSGECYDLLGTFIEFRANGELLLVNTTTQRWESDDCIKIRVTNAATGVDAAEYEVLSLSDNKMTLDVGTTVDLIREN